MAQQAKTNGSSASQLDEMIDRCESVLANPSNKEARIRLVNDYVAAYEIPIAQRMKIPVSLRGVDPEQVEDSTISTMRTTLRAYKDHLDNEIELARAKASSITAQATSTAVASVSVNQVFDLIDADDSLSEEDKATIQSLLMEAKKNAVKEDSGAFAKIGARILEGIEKATPGVVSGALGWLASLAAKYFGA